MSRSSTNVVPSATAPLEATAQNINDCPFIMQCRRATLCRVSRTPAASERKSRRGRPPNSDGQETAARLLDAAAAACAESGFDGATLNEIARRAGVTAAAIYNHYDSREDLLYAAGVRALER